MTSFIGRKRELQLLKDLLKRKIASFVVVKGRRRIGKSRLIEEFAKDLKFFSFSGLTPTKGIGAQEQRDNFARQLARHFSIPIPYSNDWGDLFWHLAHQTKRGRYIILLDEISWMGTKDSTFLPKLKNAWDLDFKKNPEFILVVCGSVSSWIEKNILRSTGFVGRIDLNLTLNELSLIDCNAFWGSYDKNWSNYEKFKILSVTGGVPRYLEIISPEDTAEENIKKLCFVKEGFLFNEFDQIFNDLFGKKSILYRKILLSLIENPNSSLNDLFGYLKIEKSGVISNYVDDLMLAGFLKKDFTWSLPSGKESTLSHLRVNDNYVRFYLKNILPNTNKIENDEYVNRSLTSLPGWEALMGYQFENLVLSNRSLIHKHLNINPSEVVMSNPYFQRKTTTESGCQIDYMVQTRFNNLYICEIKFSKNPVGTKVIDDVNKKIKVLNLPRHFSYRPVLIHVNGVSDGVIDSEYFANIIDFGSLLQS